ncbi:hypothetical protein SteCoe_39125 [Stentor coeruleus]|uniref:Uncharacterized protein n=1 Tax=Stentor coeruleus TaxID=5963 RepID=A0A1R2AKT8_9CILI|nr:hypothetical protein SteCoe_39125 [Stentor coeruleus]
MESQGPLTLSDLSVPKIDHNSDTMPKSTDSRVKASKMLLQVYIEGMVEKNATIILNPGRSPVIKISPRYSRMVDIKDVRDYIVYSTGEMAPEVFKLRSCYNMTSCKRMIKKMFIDINKEENKLLEKIDYVIIFNGMTLKNQEKIILYAKKVPLISCVIWMNAQHYDQLKPFYRLEEEVLMFKVIVSDMEREIQEKNAEIKNIEKSNEELKKANEEVKKANEEVKKAKEEVQLQLKEKEEETMRLKKYIKQLEEMNLLT